MLAMLHLEGRYSCSPEIDSFRPFDWRQDDSNNIESAKYIEPIGGEPDEGYETNDGGIDAGALLYELNDPEHPIWPPPSARYRTPERTRARMLWDMALEELAQRGQPTTLAEVARATGIHSATLRRWRDDRPEQRRVHKIPPFLRKRLAAAFDWWPEAVERRLSCETSMVERLNAEKDWLATTNGSPLLDAEAIRDPEEREAARAVLADEARRLRYRATADSVSGGTEGPE